MSPWSLLALLLFVWVLWLFASMAEVAVSEARKGIPEGERRQVSLLPGIPVFPLLFWGIALLFDWISSPWGTLVIVGVHIILGIFWAVSIIRYTRALAQIDSAT